MLRTIFAWAVFVLGLALPAQAETSHELATEVANTVGIGRVGRCSNCHATSSEQTLTRWAEATKRVDACLNLETAEAKLSCITGKGLEGASTLEASQLGFYAAGLHLAPLSGLFEEALGASTAKTVQAALKLTTLMPLRSDSPLTATQFSAIHRWSAAGMPHLKEFLSPTNGNSSCEEFSDPELKAHIEQQRDDSWRSRNESRRLPMFACSSKDALQCFQQKRDGKSLFPDVSESAAQIGWKADSKTQMRFLTDLPSRTQYWIRSSTDGRFVAYGASTSAIIDLQGLLAASPTQRVISVAALYDPAFFPDDSGFVFQGSRTGFCNMSILRSVDTTLINFSEDACSMLNANRLPLYQSIGASLDGADYLAAASAYQRDSGTSSTFDEHMPSEDVTAEASNQLWLYPIAYDGETWTRQPIQTFDTPYEIDWQMAYSNQLISSRLQGKRDGITRTLGYNLYKLTRDAGGKYRKARVAQLCTEGLKGAFSFDDRFFISYSYIRADHWKILGYASAQDPAFVQKLQAGTANIFLHDLYTGKRTILTNMGASQYALFPHFRNDGWIYFEVFDSVSGVRRVLVSDAAILAERAAPVP